MSKKGKDDDGSVSPPTSSDFDQAILIKGPVTPWLQNPTEVENEIQARESVPIPPGPSQAVARMPNLNQPQLRQLQPHLSRYRLGRPRQDLVIPNTGPFFATGPLIAPHLRPNMPFGPNYAQSYRQPAFVPPNKQLTAQQQFQEQNELQVRRQFVSQQQQQQPPFQQQQQQQPSFQQQPFHQPQFQQQPFHQQPLQQRQSQQQNFQPGQQSSFGIPFSSQQTSCVPHKSFQHQSRHIPTTPANYGNQSQGPIQFASDQSQLQMAQQPQPRYRIPQGVYQHLQQEQELYNRLILLQNQHPQQIQEKLQKIVGQTTPSRQLAGFSVARESFLRNVIDLQLVPSDLQSSSQGQNLRRDSASLQQSSAISHPDKQKNSRGQIVHQDPALLRNNSAEVRPVQTGCQTNSQGQNVQQNSALIPRNRAEVSIRSIQPDYQTSSQGKISKHDLASISQGSSEISVHPVQPDRQNNSAGQSVKQHLASMQYNSSEVSIHLVQPDHENCSQRPKVQRDKVTPGLAIKKSKVTLAEQIRDIRNPTECPQQQSLDVPTLPNVVTIERVCVPSSQPESSSCRAPVERTQSSTLLNETSTEPQSGVLNTPQLSPLNDSTPSSNISSLPQEKESSISSNPTNRLNCDPLPPQTAQSDDEDRFAKHVSDTLAEFFPQTKSPAKSPANSPELINLSDDEVETSDVATNRQEAKILESEVVKGNDANVSLEDDDEPKLQIVEEPNDDIPNMASVRSVVESQTNDVDRPGLDLPRSEMGVSSAPLVPSKAETAESEPSSEPFVKTTLPFSTGSHVTGRQSSNKRVSQDSDRLESSCVTYQKPPETQYYLKQYGTLACLNIRLEICVLLSQLESIVEVVFFNTGLNCGSKPAPWDGLPLGGSVKAVDHDPSSGVEYQRSYHFNNLPGSPKIMVNATQWDIRAVSENLANWISFSELLQKLDEFEEKEGICLPDWKTKHLTPDFFGDLLRQQFVGIEKTYKYQKKFQIWSPRFPSRTVLVFDRNVFFLSPKLSEADFLTALEKDYAFGSVVPARVIKRPKDVVKIFLLAEGKQVRLKAEIIQDFSNYFKVFMASSSSPTFGVVRGNPYSKLLKSFPKYQVEDTTLRRDATFRMARTVKAIVKAKIETVTSQVRSFFLVYLDRYDPGESAELILKPNSPEEMEGRAIDLLVLSKLNSSTDDYINQLLEQESKKHFIDQQVFLIRQAGPSAIWQLRVDPKWIRAEPVVQGVSKSEKAAINQLLTAVCNSAILFSSHRLLAAVFKDKVRLKSWDVLHHKSSELAAALFEAQLPDSSRGSSTLTITAIQSLFQELNPAFPNFNLVTFSASMKTQKPDPTETKSRAQSSEQSSQILLDKEQHQLVEPASSSKDVAGQWKTPKKIELSPRKVSSDHCDKLPSQKKAPLSRQISAEDVANILNPPKPLARSKSGPAPITKKGQRPSSSSSKVPPRTEIRTCDEALPLEVNNAIEQQCTSTTDLTESNSLHVHPLSSTSSLSKSRQTTFDDTSEPRKDSSETEVNVDETISRTTGKNGQMSEVYKSTREPSQPVLAVLQPTLNPVVPASSKDSTDIERHNDLSINPSKEVDKLSEVSKSTSNPPQPVLSQLQPPSIAKPPSDSSQASSREEEKISDVFKSDSQLSRPVLPSTNPVTYEHGNEASETKVNEDETIKSSTDKKLSTSESTQPVQSTSTSNPRMSSETNQKKRKTSAISVRETRSMTEKTNSISRPKRPWITRPPISTSSSSDESQEDDQQAIGERFTGGITENHETQDLDIVMKNRSSSLEIKVLSSNQREESKQNNLPERNKLTENHAEGASNCGDDSEKLDGNDDICVIKNVDAISVERFNESEIDDDEDSENGETISVDHFDRSKSNNDDNDACKAHPKDDEQNFHLGSIDFVPVVEKPNSNIKRAQGIVSYNRFLSKSSQDCFVKISESELSEANEFLDKRMNLSNFERFPPQFGNDFRTDFVDLTNYESYPDDDEEEMEEAEDLLVCHVCGYKASSENVLIFHRIFRCNKAKDCKVAEATPFQICNLETSHPNKSLMHQVLGWKIEEEITKPRVSEALPKKVFVDNEGTRNDEGDQADGDQADGGANNDQHTNPAASPLSLTKYKFQCKECHPERTLNSAEEVIEHMTETDHVDIDTLSCEE